MTEQNDTSGNSPEKQVEERIAGWNKKFLANAAENHLIEVELKKLGLTPPKPPRSPASTLPVGMEKAVKALLADKTITAGDFEEWLAKEHSIYKVAEQRKIRIALKNLGVIEEKPKAKGQSTFVWLAGEKMKNDASKP